MPRFRPVALALACLAIGLVAAVHAHVGRLQASASPAQAPAPAQGTAPAAGQDAPSAPQAAGAGTPTPPPPASSVAPADSTAGDEVAGPPAPASAVPAMPTRGLAIAGVAAPMRSPIKRDPIESRLVRGMLGTPAAGEPARDDPAAPKWTPTDADAGGAFPVEAMRGGYLMLEVDSPVEQVAMLDASGHAMVYVNGEPRMGDPYAYGTHSVPVALVKGRNEFLFAGGRAPIMPRLSAPVREGPFIDVRDVTAPDLVGGDPLEAWIGIPIINASAQPARDLVLEVACGNGAVTRTPVPAIGPLAVHKAAARIACASAATGTTVRVTATLRSGSAPGQALHEQSIDLPVRSEDAPRRETFRSAIDGSVQHYAVLPALEQKATDGAPARRPGLLLTLHGAGVEALGQASCYSPKPWAVVVAPTNRRPFGFDWEDWGRSDALEVMELARVRHRTDPLKQWLTGHSMGGHGTWQIGAHRSGDFAAIAPSAGWISFFTYGNARTAASMLPSGASDAERAIASALDTAANPSRTLLLKDNYLSQGIYTLHGDADETVPVSEAREMRTQLGQFHRDFAYREKRGAGHWWGNQCVDWPAMMDFLRARELPPPESRARIAFTTVSPAIRSTDGWVTIDAQASPLEPSTADLSLDRAARSVAGRTGNVARLALALDIDGEVAEPIRISLDGSELSVPEPSGGERVWLERAFGEDGTPGAWTVARAPGARSKRAERMGPFKAAFDRNMLLVVGTAGSDAERQALARKARYDAEQFWYRGNASPEIVDDAALLADPAIAAGRGIVLYGNSETNRAWPVVVGESPVTPVRGAIHLVDASGKRGTIAGDDLALLMVRPRADDPEAMVAIVAGTGEVGQRLTERVPYFTAGVAYPDMCVLSARMLDEGIPGIVAADFFSNDWSLRRMPALAVVNAP